MTEVETPEHELIDWEKTEYVLVSTDPLRIETPDQETLTGREAELVCSAVLDEQFLSQSRDHQRVNYPEVLRPGTSVLIGPGRDIDAEIVCAALQADLSVNYQVRWRNGSDLTTQWFVAGEFSVDEDAPQVRIGFVN